MKVSFLGNDVEVSGKQLQKGDILENFKALNGAFTKIELKDIKGKKIILGIPSLNTTVCSEEITKFNEILKDYKDINAIFITLDLPFTIANFKQDKKIADNIIILSDAKFRSFSKLSSTVANKMGILIRSVMILDENNKIIYTEYVNEISDEPDYDKIINLLKK